MIRFPLSLSQFQLGFCHLQSKQSQQIGSKSSTWGRRMYFIAWRWMDIPSWEKTVFCKLHECLMKLWLILLISFSEGLYNKNSFRKIHFFCMCSTRGLLKAKWADMSALTSFLAASAPLSSHRPRLLIGGVDPRHSVHLCGGHQEAREPITTHFLHLLRLRGPSQRMIIILYRIN